MLHPYLGTDERSYQDYLDEATGRMLEVSPGGSYAVRVAPGRNPGLSVPPGDGRWGAPGLPDDPGIAEPAASAPADEEASDAQAPPEPESVLPSLPGDPPPEDQAQPDPAAPSPEE